TPVDAVHDRDKILPGCGLTGHEDKTLPGECTVMCAGTLPGDNSNETQVLLKLPCPGPSCSEDAVSWVCLSCGSPILYSFGDYFHCSCGKGLAVNYKFKCCGRGHGHSHIPFPQEQLM